MKIYTFYILSLPELAFLISVIAILPILIFIVNADKKLNKFNLYKYYICNLFLIVITFSNNYVTFILLFLLIDIIISALIYNKNFIN
jgi:hypothetical protein